MTTVKTTCTTILAVVASIIWSIHTYAKKIMEPVRASPSSSPAMSPPRRCRKTHDCSYTCGLAICLHAAVYHSGTERSSLKSVIIGNSENVRA
jgi:hypothetical protein